MQWFLFLQTSRLVVSKCLGLADSLGNLYWFSVAEMEILSL